MWVELLEALSSLSLEYILSASRVSVSLCGQWNAVALVLYESLVAHSQAKCFVLHQWWSNCTHLKRKCTLYLSSSPLSLSPADGETVCPLLRVTFAFWSPVPVSTSAPVQSFREANKKCFLLPPQIINHVREQRVPLAPISFAPFTAFSWLKLSLSTVASVVLSPPPSDAFILKSHSYQSTWFTIVTLSLSFLFFSVLRLMYFWCTKSHNVTRRERERE